MSKKINKHKHKRNRKNFIILPILYFVVFYLAVFIISAPFISVVISYGSLLFSDNAANEIKKDKKYVDIYKPVGEENPAPTIKKDNKEYIDRQKIVYPKYGNRFGEFIIEDCNIDCNLFFGDDSASLRNGVGIYNGSFIPGYGGTIMVAGHNNTYFNGLKNAKKGQVVTIKTSYGTYTYRINDMKVINHEDYYKGYDLGKKEENLIMYTCYPFDELGLTTLRYFVYAEFVSGTPIDKSVKEAN